jgi:hypothetical protein
VVGTNKISCTRNGAMGESQEITENRVNREKTEIVS